MSSHNSQDIFLDYCNERGGSDVDAKTDSLPNTSHFSDGDGRKMPKPARSRKFENRAREGDSPRSIRSKTGGRAPAPPHD